MKELSIEEKAKAYDKAIERARVWKEKSGMPADRQGILDDIFPELKVSEDEEVRKALYEYFKKLKDDGDIDETWYGFSYDKILAWLEKQRDKPLFTFDDILALQCCMETVKKVQEDKELYEQLQSLHDRLHDAYWLEKQEHDDNTEPKYKVGDIIYKPSNSSCPVHSSIDGTLCTVIEVLDKHYILDTNEGRIQESFARQDYYELVKRNPTWSEEDIEMIDYIVSILNSNFNENDKFDDNKPCVGALVDFLNSIKDRVQLQSKQEWSEEDENCINYILINCMNYVKECGLVKELHNDELHEQAKVFLKSLKERVQPKQELSEEDKCMLNNIIDTLKPLSQTTHSGYAINSMIDWLKERYTWKPND